MKKRTHSTIWTLLLVAGFLGAGLDASAAQPKRLLVVSATKGFRHDSIPTGDRILEQLGRESGAFTVEYCRGGANGKDDA